MIRHFIVALGVLLFTSSAVAQFEGAEVLGTVRDNTGAVLTKAAIKLTNQDTGIESKTATDDNGNYDFLNVRVGRYKLTAELTGMAPFSASGILVDVNARRRVDITMQVGAVSEVVEVQASAEVLNTDTSEHSQVVNTQQIVELPLNGRNCADLALLSTNVSRSPMSVLFSATGTPREGAFNVNGMRSTYNNFLLDGLDNNAYSPSNQGYSSQVVQASPDAVAEFRVITSNFNAEYGRVGGGVVSAAMRAGTNQLHGTAYEFLRNTDLNAVGFFAPTGGQKPTLQRNQFGFTVGGPFIKNKLFFFADYEGYRQLQRYLNFDSLPTLADRSGVLPSTVYDRVRLYLLDSNDAANFPVHRGITSELYGGGPELRLKQEMLLGIGGWRLLRALGLQPEICHLNEGHAALAVLERARSFMEETGQPFEVALAVTRAGNLFTTHTAVAAGFDRFAPALIEQYLGGYAEKKLGISLNDLLALGRQNPADSSEPFNMAYLAMRGSGAANGVSRLHGKVSRRLFLPLFPRWPEDEIPIGHVTNGVHMPTWDSASADDLWTETCGKDRWLGTTETLEQDMRRVSDARLWQFRTSASRSLVEHARERLAVDMAGAGAPPEQVDAAKHLFDPNALTLGFARRFATYKRPNLLLHDPQRLLRLLTNSQHPVQLVIAGKAHPEDDAGQSLIREWMHFIRQPETRPHAIFLSDYDMLLTEHLVQGVDVWINTPRRPWEACGTSGMKVLVNGGLNLSELDGWWAEAYTPDAGWALGDGQEHHQDQDGDAAAADALYGLLEREVIPEFYARDEQGIPTAWVGRMRNSMASLTPRFSADRAVREYTEKHYLPGAATYRERAADKGAVGRQMVDWRHALETEWPGLRFGEVKVETDGGQHTFEVQVYLNDLDPHAAQVDLYADGGNGDGPIRQEMEYVRQLPGATGGRVYSARVPASRPADDYTVRVAPHHSGVAVPLEAARILWHR